MTVVDPREEVTPEISSPSAPGHRPVLAHQLIESLQIPKGATVVDGTLGAGGITSLMSDRVGPTGRVIAIDRDPDAVARAEVNFSHITTITPVRGNFADLLSILQSLQIKEVDAVALDLGISSIQLDDPARGFSFRHDGPLDMRMDQSYEDLTAADVVNEWSAEDLTRILFEYGDEKYSRRIVREIVKDRTGRPITTTSQLRQCVERAVPGIARSKRLHPATKTFQALRIVVNEELRSLEEGLQAAIQALRPGGRLGVISFHSLEDTLVKNTLHVAAKNCLCPPQQPVCTCAHRASLSLPTRKAIKPDQEEIDTNPRSRSARLRIAQKL